MKDHNLYRPKPGLSTIKKDFQTVEWGREANASWIIGKSSNPVFFTQDGHNARIEDSAKGLPILLCDGNVDINYNLINTNIWSIGKAINKFNCTIWTPGLDVSAYSNDYWKSPACIKLMPLANARMRRPDGKLISHSPFCFYYRRHTSFNAVNFLSEETILEDGSENSDILSSIKLAVVMGYREIYLACNMNMKSKAFQMLQQINKMLNNEYLKIYNCGNIELFPSIKVDEACRKCILR